jgi:integrase/recombinase XerC
MTFEDVSTQNRRLWVRLREKGGKRHAVPCHHNLEEYLTAYLDGAGLRGDPKGPLFRTIGRGTGKLMRTVLPQANAYARALIRRRPAPLLDARGYRGRGHPCGSVHFSRTGSADRSTTVVSI